MFLCTTAFFSCPTPMLLWDAGLGVYLPCCTNQNLIPAQNYFSFSVGFSSIFQFFVLAFHIPIAAESPVWRPNLPCYWLSWSIGEMIHRWFTGLSAELCKTFMSSLNISLSRCQCIFNDLIEDDSFIFWISKYLTLKAGHYRPGWVLSVQVSEQLVSFPYPFQKKYEHFLILYNLRKQWSFWFVCGHTTVYWMSSGESLARLTYSSV